MTSPSPTAQSNVRAMGAELVGTAVLMLIGPGSAVLAVDKIGVYGVALAGWSSNSKYPLLGGLRSSAQMVSYELALTMSVVGVLLLAGSFNLREIITAQQGFLWGWLPRWNIFAAFCTTSRSSGGA